MSKTGKLARPGLAIALAALLAAAPSGAQESGGGGEGAAPVGGGALTGAEETYDLLFRGGTLDEIDGGLVYTRKVRNTAAPEAAARDTGTIEIGFEEGSGDTPRLAAMRFHQDDRSKGIGSFPASVGNPVIMYFVESVIRDMAETAGGSPFYIRNRVKDALVQPAEVETVTFEFDGTQVEGRAVTLRPFQNDPNRDRMQGFGDLALTVTMSEAVPGWYHGLTAEIEEDAGTDGARSDYRSVMTFEGMAGETAR
ncbi:hypothetical protein [Profundibacterium mesophilum]|uniref:Uncharacterized protein n=1 Tax=Profundibacterium mesophilum KAUST100406-0324 TaxID=1037889 RepID=A0A921NSN9_9RHOB|nr:hypothetical protein [Profundibacterium mesophilum]KAF0674703.1 hypothetical protein PMES_03086 [Profundibacterium mesophilum KAUST100406-0324]